MKKIPFYTELCYVVGILLPAIAGAMMTKADFGLSMIIAPSYILHCKLSQYHGFFTFGTCAYLFQAILLLLLIVVLRRFRISYLFSFVTAVLFGLCLDGATLLLHHVVVEALWLRLLFFISGVLICAIGIGFMLHTYIASEVYELLVKEISLKFNVNMGLVKTLYDLSSLVLAVLLSLLFFRTLVGVGWGTLICALLNGVIINITSKWIDKHLDLKDGLPLRRFFEK